MDATAPPSDLQRRRALLAADPFGEGIVGGFFGKGPPPGVLSGLRFERLGTEAHPFLMRVRSLPTRDAVEHALSRLGEAARPLMEEWRALYAPLDGGADGLAARAGYVPMLDYTPEAPVLSDRTLESLALGTAGYGEANDVYEAEIARRAFPPARTPELHLLEDARIATALVRAGVPATFATVFGATTIALDFPNGDRVPRERKLDDEEAADVRASFGANNAYWLLGSFVSLCGRRMVETAGVRHLVLTLLDMARQGMDRAFVKDTILKGGTWIVDLTGVRDETSAASRLIAALGPLWFHLLARIDLESDNDVRRFVVQEFVPFVREHRFFCIADRIVASTASDRTLSVLDAPPPHRRLDSRVAVLARPASDPGPYDRGPTTSVEDRKGVADMARLVRRLLAAIRENDFVGRSMLPRAFVVDAGLAADGSVGLIEINTFRNAGLYAVDYDRVARALTGVASWPDWVGLFDGTTAPADRDGETMRDIGTVARLVMKAMPEGVRGSGDKVKWVKVDALVAELADLARGDAGPEARTGADPEDG